GADPDVAAVGQGQDAVGTGPGYGHRAAVDGDVGAAAGDADAVGIAAGGGDAGAAHGDVAVVVDALHRDSVGEVALGDHLLAVHGRVAATAHADGDGVLAAGLHPATVHHDRAAPGLDVDAVGVADRTVFVMMGAAFGQHLARMHGHPPGAAGDDAGGIRTAGVDAVAVHHRRSPGADHIQRVRVEAFGTYLATCHRHRAGAAGLAIDADRVVAGGVHQAAGQVYRSGRIGRLPAGLCADAV